MARIEQRDNWLGQRMATATDQELRELFEEIHHFRRTGILVGGKLRALEKEFSDNVSHTPLGDCMRLVEDKVLFEMGRRFHNAED